MLHAHALIRPPADSFVGAISSTQAKIDVALARAQHTEYCLALEAAGLTVERLLPDERYPDSCFIQDPAVVISGQAVICRPGAPSRRGEEVAAAEALEGRLPLHRIVAPGTLEGGDVMVLPDRVVVGLSGRTNSAGVAQLAVALAGAALPVYSTPVAPYLHLLTAVTYVGDATLLAVEDWQAPPALAHLRVLHAPIAEAYAANSLALGRYAVVPAGFPRVAAMLHAHGLEILSVPVSEFAKADGGVTCLSLLW